MEKSHDKRWLFRRDSKQVCSVPTISFLSDIHGRGGITSDDLFHFIFTKPVISPEEPLPHFVFLFPLTSLDSHRNLL